MLAAGCGSDGSSARNDSGEPDGESEAPLEADVPGAVVDGSVDARVPALDAEGATLDAGNPAYDTGSVVDETAEAGGDAQAEAAETGGANGGGPDAASGDDANANHGADAASGGGDAAREVDANEGADAASGGDDAATGAHDAATGAHDATVGPGDDASASESPDSAVADGGAALSDATTGIPDAGADAAPYTPNTGGYAIRCGWLLDTSGMIAHAKTTANFYTSQYDTQFGGLYTFIERSGTVSSTNKSFQVESRDAYAFAHAFMLTGNEAYLTGARTALDFLYAHAWDTAHDGFVFLGDRTGKWLPLPPGVGSDKWVFTEHYCAAGSTAICEATGNATDCDWMNKGMALLTNHYLDPVFGGYFENANLDFSSRSGKGFYPTVDGIASHMLATYLVTQNPAYRTQLVSVADDAVNHLVASMTAPGVVYGFSEDYNSNWSIETSSTYGFVGHLYKTAWGLARAYQLTQDPKYLTAARKILTQQWTSGGFDHTNGAPNKDYNWNQGVTSTNKVYWELEEAFTGSITNWYVATSDADRAIDVETADRSLCFYMHHMVDPQYGGVFFEVNADGSQTVDTDKSDQYEGFYHDVEFSYEVYIYGNLLLWHRPITLYYRFDAASQSRSVVLTPEPLEAGALSITGVTLAGAPYSSFDGASRTLTLPAGTGGVFAVTFAHAP